ncbi:MAG TPA: DUF2784 domain-containing protein [Burkholderiales bacterium]|nr:DUF2784 domain-containing protein [Burkholderiales bacterium]
MPYQQLADAVLALHALVVAFIVGGLVAIIAGNFLGWRWVNFGWFRRLHLLAIAIVAAQSWLGVACPLTWLEAQLRIRAQQSPYGASFVEHWLQELLYYQAPAWAFVTAYTLFGIAVAACWWIFSPRRNRQRS